MRVIHNLTSNTAIDGAEEVARAIKAVNEMLSYGDDIIESLKNPNSKIDFFQSRQVYEERVKAILVSKSDGWNNAVIGIEKHPYLAGQIGFILEFSGILKYYDDHKNCDWYENDDKKFYAAFANYSAKSEAALTFMSSSRNSDYLWERAVLTKGDYLLAASAYRYNLLSTSRFPRDYSWKRLLRLPTEDAKAEEIKYWKQRRGYVKDVFDDSLFDEKSVEHSLAQLIKNSPGDWRDLLIKNAEHIRYCGQGFIRYASDDDILLFKHSQMNHMHRELYTYNLWLNLDDSFQKNCIFKQIEHVEVRSAEEFSYLLFNEFCLKRINYSIEVYYRKPNAVFKHPYQIWFVKSKGNNDQSAYPDEIIDELQKLNFSWYQDSEWAGFFITKVSEKEVKEIILKLGQTLILL
jgi:hypothetical protein